IATAFEYNLHPVGPIVLGGLALYPAAQALDLLRFYREFGPSAPEELGTVLAFLTAPPAPFVPPEVQGQPMVALGACYAGPIEEGKRGWPPWRDFGPPALDLIQPMPYTAVQRLFDDGVPFGNQVYLKSDHLAALSEDVAETIATHTARV